ncbi:MAG: hypothetical protein ACK5LX_01630 [Oscillospiraceae bacterium]
MESHTLDEASGFPNPVGIMLYDFCFDSGVGEQHEDAGQKQASGDRKPKTAENLQPGQYFIPPINNGQFMALLPLL